MKFSKHEKIDLLAIMISAISLIASFILSIDYLSWIAVILCGIPIFKECAEGLITEFDIKADLLVSIAIVASIIIGEVFAAGEIATIMAIGGFLEEYTVSKTQGRIKELVNMTPQVAVRIRNGKEERILASEVQIGDILKVLPGENIPTDGRIINGETSIDQSTLTGESIPVDKKANDDVYSGTINLYGSFTMETTKVSDDSSLQKLIKLVESSSPENANVVRQADKWATFVVAIAFTAAILTYLYTFEIARSVTILVVFCPCHVLSLASAADSLLDVYIGIYGKIIAYRHRNFRVFGDDLQLQNESVRDAFDEYRASELICGDIVILVNCKNFAYNIISESCHEFASHFLHNKIVIENFYVCIG